ncbi:MAG: cytochrome c oxidase subunit II [Acidimicrobiia bacterium]|nr:cytochrome c oxidase subunit II [Acidimicrobiia bacterium]
MEIGFGRFAGEPREQAGDDAGVLLAVSGRYFTSDFGSYPPTSNVFPTSSMGSHSTVNTAVTQKKQRRLLLGVGFTMLVLVLSACGTGGAQDGLSPASEKARNIDGLFTLTLIIAAVVFVLVQGAIIYTAIKFRRKKGEAPKPVKQIHGNTKLEIAWTIAPALILAGLAVPTVQTIFENAADPVNAVEITVTGHQWWWEYDYSDLGVITANEMHIPVGQDIALTLTADAGDVIHSFWVPRLSGKRDLVPGHENTLTISADEPGLYLGQCAEFCGLSHANMRLRVYAHEPADFEAWVQSQLAAAVIPADTDESLRAEGWELFISKGCSACHGINGTEAVGGGLNPGPNLTHFAQRDTFAGALYDSTTENLSAWLANPSELKSMRPDLNRGMPNLGLSDDEISALVAFLQGLD